MTSVTSHHTDGRHDRDHHHGGRPDADSFSLEDRYTRDEGTVFLTGIQALARMVRDRARLDRRQNLATGSLISGYEGSPLAGYDLEISRRARTYLDPYDVVHRPALNEELGATSVMGAQLASRAGTLGRGPVSGEQLAGVVGYWYGKAPGLDRATDALRHANLVGTDPNGGAVALVGDDPGAKSSTVPCASEMALADLYMPILYPADSQDILDLGVHAAVMSRVSGLWTSLKISAHVADGSSTAVVHPDRVLPHLGDLGRSPHVPDARLLGATLMELEQNQLTTRIPRALEYARINGINRMVARTADDRIGIVAAGKTYLDVRSALARLGLDEDELARRGIRLLKLGMVYPMEREMLYRFVDGLDEVIVVEEKRDFIETMIREILYDRPHTPDVRGKTNEDGSTLFSRFGELDVDSVTRGLAHRLGTVHGLESVRAWQRGAGRGRGRIELPVLNRSPYFCSGCPHNSSTKVSEGTLVGAGIGCHAMVLLQPESQVGDITGITQMGGEGAQWLGMAPFVSETHFVQNVGDGTFDHSASLALRAAVGAGENITYKLLFNGTVAMTGGQDTVGGKSLAETCRLLLAEKVAKVVVTTDDVRRTRRAGIGSGALRDVEVRDRADMLDVQRELAAVPGVTVLVHDQHCAAEKRRGRKRGTVPTPTERVVINERICEGCGDCGQKSNCLSVHPVDTEFGRKTRIDQSSCNLDLSCLDGDCPSFVTVTPGEKRRASVTVPDLDDDEVAAPGTRALTGEAPFHLRITGIGGTGIVTVSAVLATAAVLDGHVARTLDMTGLAQKGGAVVSDITLTAGPQELSAKVATGEADLYLCADGLVGADPVNLKVAGRDRTTAVISTTRVPTGQMVVDTAVGYPADAQVSGAVERACARAVRLDAGELSERLFGETVSANMLLVGAAFQSGALPVSAASIERAVELNGVAVERNLQAFRRGRQAVADPAALTAALEAAHPAPAPAEPSAAALRVLAGLGPVGAGLRDAVALRVEELVAYQDETYALRYLDRVERIRAAEQRAVPGSEELTDAVARHLHKLMAYKDEYEVARLALDTAFSAKVAEEFGDDARVAIRLHPPVLRALGLQRKIAVGEWARPALAGLARAKRLRGTRADVFGLAGVRRLERSLLAEYEQLVDRMAAHLERAVGTSGIAAARQHVSWIADAARVAALPDMVRGYESVKERNAEAYRAELAEGVAALF
ncbi:indolepyruvate ferredoxin oxidoreductase family protein [Dietzia sp. 179-F 9C3 NHS]|uniref:indolepyruvate ferredoxin oxidoreductase family protein n=1 Tax=Dietzia sp. 179-F 9C3 NHS TaxID=3374295 RepID=UPI003878FE54